jgi:hypothetical protein
LRFLIKQDFAAAFVVRQKRLRDARSDLRVPACGAGFAVGFQPGHDRTDRLADFLHGQNRRGYVRRDSRFGNELFIGLPAVRPRKLPGRKDHAVQAHFHLLRALKFPQVSGARQHARRGVQHRYRHGDYTLAGRHLLLGLIHHQGRGGKDHRLAFAVGDQPAYGNRYDVLRGAIGEGHAIRQPRVQYRRTRGAQHLIHLFEIIRGRRPCYHDVGDAARGYNDRLRRESGAQQKPE